MTRLKRLFEPINLGKLALPNRIIMSAVTTRFDFEDNDRQANFYAERARGGVGLIILGAYQTIYPGRKSGVNRAGLYDDTFIPLIKRWVKAIHDNGGRCAAQLATYPYWSRKGPEGTPEHVGPSAFVFPREGTHPSISLAEFLPEMRELTTAEIQEIEEAIGDAAVRAREAGFDAVEMQCVGGNIPVLFTNPFINRRTDRYGGSAENRVRLLCESIANIKKKIGSDFPMVCRIPGDDMLPFGMGLAGWQELAPYIEKAGVNALNIYPVWHESRPPKPQMSVPRGAFVHLAEGIKKVVRIPVVAALRINDPLMAEEILEKGKADLVSMTRPLIADPEMPRKAKEDRLDDIVMCTACCRCYDDLGSGRAMSCSVNARCGKEAEYRIATAAKPKKVLVIGGGPAGMEASRVAAVRGHEVTLFEKNSRLGGQLLQAVVPPYKDEWKTTIQYLSRQMTELKVKVHLNEACTPEKVAKEKPDALIIATGAAPVIPNIPGVTGSNVITSIDVLSGKKQAGRNAVVIGGGSVGCETAEFLARQGSNVTILEMLKTIGVDYGPVNRYVVIDRLVAAGIRLETGARAIEINNRGVRIDRIGWCSEFFEADTVVLACGMCPSNHLASELEGKAPLVLTIGDCVKVAGVKEAIEGGFVAGTRV